MELIRITTDAQGASVVSARELYQFLEVKKHFADWIKARVEKYGLVEGQDYTTFSLIGEKGRPQIEYALTIDAAKELAMVEGNAKGKEARQYFIEAEKTLRRAMEAPVLSTEQMLTQVVQVLQQQTQIIASTQEQIGQLRADVDMIMSGQRPPRQRPGQQLSLPGTPAPKAVRPKSGLRQAVFRKVSEYSGYHGAEQSETYSHLYRRLYDVYGINTYRLMRVPGESILDSIERYGHLDKLYALVCAELIYIEE